MKYRKKKSELLKKLLQSWKRLEVKKRSQENSYLKRVSTEGVLSFWFFRGALYAKLIETKPPAHLGMSRIISVSQAESSRYHEASAAKIAFLISVPFREWNLLFFIECIGTGGFKVLTSTTLGPLMWHLFQAIVCNCCFRSLPPFDFRWHKWSCFEVAAYGNVY